MDNNYEPTLRHYAIIGLSIPLIWAGLDTIAKHEPRHDYRGEPTCINPGKEGSIESLKKKLNLDSKIEKEVFGKE